MLALVRIVLLVTIFATSVAWLYYLVSVAAPVLPGDEDEKSGESFQLSFPHNLDQLKQLSAILSRFSTLYPRYVLVLFCSAYLFKQTFAIPGSVFMNLLGGAIYGTWLAFPLCCLLTASGATACYLLSMLSGRILVQRYLPTHLARLRSAIEPHQSRLLWILISLRLFPITPNWFLNIASPIVNIPIKKFFVSVFLGLMPYNFMCVQTGSILAEINSMDDVFSLKSTSSLLLVAIAFAIPAVIRRQKLKTK